jgi:hypothetical protein
MTIVATIKLQVTAKPSHDLAAYNVDRESDHFYKRRKSTLCTPGITQDRASNERKKFLQFDMSFNEFAMIVYRLFLEIACAIARNVVLSIPAFQYSFVFTWKLFLLEIWNALTHILPVDIKVVLRGGYPKPLLL